MSNEDLARKIYKEALGIDYDRLTLIQKESAIKIAIYFKANLNKFKE
jgi:hypothetical protein